MIGLAPKLSNEEIEGEITKKAAVLSEEFRQRGLNAIANIFADICSLIAFGFVVAFSRREIEIVKSFLDGILYNLSDSAKAFLIILFTDICRFPLSPRLGSDPRRVKSSFRFTGKSRV
jgi:hypothetical protein